MVKACTAARNAADAAEPAQCTRIALVIGSMLTGGAQRVALNLAEEFAERGFAVDLIPLVTEGPLLSEVPPSVSLVSLGGGRGRNSVLALRRYIREVRPSALIAFAFHVNLVAALSALGTGTRTRLILTVHNAFSESLRHHPAITRLWMNAGTVILYRLADRIAAVSAGAALDLASTARLPHDDIAVIHNPVIRDDFDALMEPAPADGWARDKTRQLVVAVGRLSRQKDYSTLIRSFSKVTAATSARLLIIGEGDMRAELERMVATLGLSESVKFLGHVENPVPYMAAANAFVLSSAWEGFGNVVVEAMATGTPVVSTDCPHGPAEILEHGKWGRLVPVGDEEALADAMLQTLRFGGVDARARARDFTVKAAADKYLALVESSTPRGGQRVRGGAGRSRATTGCPDPALQLGVVFGVECPNLLPK